MQTRTKKIILTVLLGIAVISFCIAGYIAGLKGSTNLLIDCTDDYRQELELDYWHTKSELVDEVQEYINEIAPSSDLSAIVVVNACEEYNIDIAFVLAQGHNESHFGTRGLAFKTNSVWNQGAYDGLPYDKIKKKYKYEHPDQSMRPYLSLLNRRYLVDGKTEYDMFDNFVDVNGSRYASYTKYEQELKMRYDEIKKNTKLDSLILMMRKQQLRLNR